MKLDLNSTPVVHDFVLSRGTSDAMEGIVVDENDNPLSGVEVRLVDRSNTYEGSKWSTFEYSQVDHTDEDGLFRFEVGGYELDAVIEPIPGSAGDLSIQAFSGDPEYSKYLKITKPESQTQSRRGFDEEKSEYPLGAKNIKIVRRSRRPSYLDEFSESRMGMVAFQGTVTDAAGRPVPDYEIRVIMESKNLPYAPALSRQQRNFNWIPVRSEDGIYFIDQVRSDMKRYLNQRFNPAYKNYLRESNGVFYRILTPTAMAEETLRFCYQVVVMDRIFPIPEEINGGINFIIGIPPLFGEGG